MENGSKFGENRLPRITDADEEAMTKGWYADRSEEADYLQADTAEQSEQGQSGEGIDGGKSRERAVERVIPGILQI